MRLVMSLQVSLALLACACLVPCFDQRDLDSSTVGLEAPLHARFVCAMPRKPLRFLQMNYLSPPCTDEDLCDSEQDWVMISKADQSQQQSQQPQRATSESTKVNRRDTEAATTASLSPPESGQHSAALRTAHVNRPQVQLPHRLRSTSPSPSLARLSNSQHQESHAHLEQRHQSPQSPRPQQAHRRSSVAPLRVLPQHHESELSDAFLTTDSPPDQTFDRSRGDAQVHIRTHSHSHDIAPVATQGERTTSSHTSPAASPQRVHSQPSAALASGFTRDSVAHLAAMQVKHQKEFRGVSVEELQRSVRLFTTQSRIHTVQK